MSDLLLLAHDRPRPWAARRLKDDAQSCSGHGVLSLRACAFRHAHEHHGDGQRWPNAIAADLERDGFGEHWLQRLSLVLARGQGDLVLEAVKTARKNHRGRDGGRGASAEWSQTDCQPCVSLV